MGRERNLGGINGSFYDGELDRFCESGAAHQRATIDGAPPEARLQTLYENSFYMAEGSAIGGFGSELSASRARRQDRQGHVCRSRFGWPRKGIRQPHQSSLRQFSAPGFRRSSIGQRWHKTDA